MVVCPFMWHHRWAVYPDESCCMACLKTVFCWGCSIAQVNRELRHRRHNGEAPLDGTEIFSLLHMPQPNHM
jgi:hypothetical protein